MGEEKILTISIPTYNRPEALLSQLNALLPQLNDEVALIVRDNNSTYDLRTYAPNLDFKTFEYIRNDHNIGADANIARCLETCETRWLWILSDDDLIKNDALVNIMQTLKLNDDCCYINFQTKIEKKVIGIIDFADYFEYKGVLPGAFCTSLCIYNAEKLKSELFFFYRNVSTMMTQFIFLLEYLKNNPEEKCTFSTIEIVEFQSLNISWSREDFIVYTSIIFYIFRNDSKLFGKNIFKALGTMYIEFIFKEMSNVSLTRKLYLLKFTISTIGLFNIFYFNVLTLCDVILYNILPNLLYTKIKSRVVKLYTNARH